jgi:lysophospholipase L1-like esterase
MPDDKFMKIVGIGDSITYGYPYISAESWLNLAAERLHIAYVNSGVNGDTTNGMSSRFVRDVIRHQPTHVIIMGGTNDAYLGIDLNNALDNIRDMSELAIKHGIEPIIGLPIPCNDEAEAVLLGHYRVGMRSYADRNGLAVIDFHAAMVDKSGTKIKAGLHIDGVHPNAAGYQVMAEVAMAAFNKLIRE